MTTERIDPLAVMDAEIASLPTMATMARAGGVNCNPDEAVRRMTAARAAVAELVEAVREIREHAQHHPDCDLVANGIDGDCWCGLFGSSERIDAALAAFGRQG